MKKYYLSTVTAIFFWSASFIATSIAYTTIAPFQLGMVRALIAALLFFLVRKFLHNHEKPEKEDYLHVGLSGVLGITLYFSFENLGVEMTTSSNAALIVASFPAMTVLLESIIDRALPSLSKVIGIVTAIIGVAILTGANAVGSSNQALGNILLIAAGAVCAVYNMVTRKIAKKYSSFTLTAYQMLLGGYLFIPLVMVEAKPWQIPTLASGIAIMFLSVCCSLLAFFLYNYGLQKISTNVAVSLMNLVPVLGIFFSLTILHEAISLQQIIGGLVVIAGVTLSTITKKEDLL